MKASHIQELKNWLASPGHLYMTEKLRAILGEILKSVNSASTLYKRAAKSTLRPEDKPAVEEVLQDLQNYNEFKALLPQVTAAIGNTNPTILNLIHTLEHAYFNPDQVNILRDITAKTATNSGDFPEEVNKEGLDAHLSHALYDLKDEGDKTLKVIREILQNAVDATDPDQHPELKNRQNSNRIDIYTKIYENYMDLIVHDKGVGMNWDLLSQKFFVTFESGKKTAAGAAGGFGIAKALIQETPQHGWSIDTNGMHSSRFHKNLYFGTRSNQKYQTPTSKIQKLPDGGTVLSLYGLPKVENYQIEELCKVYATNGKVSIFLNNDLMVPKFTINSSEMSQSLNDLPNLVGKNSTEREIATSIFAKLKGNIEKKIEKVETDTGPQTTIKFLYRKNPYWGGVYIFINGQYQFHKPYYLPSLDIICSIRTTARPGSDEYPLDPGRNMVRGNVGKEIDEVTSTIKSYIEKTKETDTFKQGIDAIMVNGDSAPMSTGDEDKPEKSEMERTLTLNISRLMINNEKNVEEVIQNTLGKPLTQTQAEVLNALYQDAAEEEDQKIKQEKIKMMIAGLLTPANIMIQRNFVAREALNTRMELMAEMIILWQKSLQVIIKELEGSGFSSKGKKFIPGLIFSDECLALYMAASEDQGRPYPSVSINPIVLAAAINPKAFQDKLEDKKSEEAFNIVPELEKEKAKANDTPINRVSKFLFHEAIHELCHLLHPQIEDDENFHKNITKLEILCHDSFEDIRKLTKAYMKTMKSKAAQLLTVIAKHVKKQPKTEHHAQLKNLLIAGIGYMIRESFVTYPTASGGVWIDPKMF